MTDVPTDEYLRQYWRSQGGEFFGPNIETGFMAEARLLPLLRKLLDTGKPVPADNEVAPAAAQCADWNRSYLVGTEVILTKDLGEEVATQTRSAAFVSNSGHPVIFLNGIRGYYLLERVRVAPAPKTEERG